MIPAGLLVQHPSGRLGYRPGVTGADGQASARPRCGAGPRWPAGPAKPPADRPPGPRQLAAGRRARAPAAQVEQADQRSRAAGTAGGEYAEPNTNRHSPHQGDRVGAAAAAARSRPTRRATQGATAGDPPRPPAGELASPEIRLHRRAQPAAPHAAAMTNQSDERAGSSAITTAAPAAPRGEHPDARRTR